MRSCLQHLLLVQPCHSLCFCCTCEPTAGQLGPTHHPLQDQAAILAPNRLPSQELHAAGAV